MTTQDKINKLTWANGINKIKDILKDIVSTTEYQVYTALLSKTGTGNPTPTIIGSNTSNFLGNFVWTRTDAGTFIGTLSGAFTNKTQITAGVPIATGGTFYMIMLDTTVGTGITANTISLTYQGIYGDVSDEMVNVPIEIKVYK